MSDFSFQWLLSSLFHPHPSFVHCSEHSKDGHCKDRLSFMVLCFYIDGIGSHLLDDCVYQTRSSWLPVSDQIGTETVRTPFGAFDIWDDNVRASRHVVSLLTMSIFPLKLPSVGIRCRFCVRCEATGIVHTVVKEVFSWSNSAWEVNCQAPAFPL